MNENEIIELIEININACKIQGTENALFWLNHVLKQIKDKGEL